MLGVNIKAYQDGAWIIGVVDDWPEARVSTEVWERFSLPTPLIGEAFPREISIVLEMQKLAGIFPCAVMGLTYSPGPGGLLIEVPVSPSYEPFDQSRAFVGPLGNHYMNGWEPSLTGFTVNGLATGFGPESAFGGTLRLAFAGYHINTGPKMVEAGFAPRLCRALLAKIIGESQPEGWSEVAPQDDGTFRWH